MLCELEKVLWGGGIIGRVTATLTQAVGGILAIPFHHASKRILMRLDDVELCQCSHKAADRLARGQVHPMCMPEQPTSPGCKAVQGIGRGGAQVDKRMDLLCCGAHQDLTHASAQGIYARHKQQSISAEVLHPTLLLCLPALGLCIELSSKGKIRELCFHLINNTPMHPCKVMLPTYICGSGNSLTNITQDMGRINECPLRELGTALSRLRLVQKTGLVVLPNDCLMCLCREGTVH